MKRKNVSRRLVRIIPNRLFYDIWESANSLSKEEYLHKFITADNKYRFAYKKYDIRFEYYLEMLELIYSRSTLTLKEIVDEIGMTKAEFRYLFGFPTRTMDAWYYGQNPCPAYVRLMLLRYFGKLDLGHHIYIEAEEPKLYSTKSSNKKLPEMEDEVNDTKEDDGNEDFSITDYYRQSSQNSLKTWEQEHVHQYNSEVQALLEQLKYLDR